MKSHTIKFLAAISVGAIALSGCSNSGSDTSDSFSVSENVLDSLLPANTQLSMVELNLLFAPIVEFTKSGGIKYVQAQSISSNKDSTVWTIKFRKGWTFHNGEPVTAQSYADAWNLTAYGPNAYVNSGQLSNIKGYANLNPKSGKPKTKKMSGLKVVDRHTLRVSLSTPDSQFPYKLSSGSPGFFPMPKAGLKDIDSFKTKPIGDGPYKMDGAAKLNSEVKLTAYDDYQGAKAQTKNIDVKIYTDDSTAYTDAQAGNLDIALVSQGKFPQVKSDFHDNRVTVDAPAVEYLGFPLFDKRFKNIDLRRAISMAINREAINNKIFAGIYEPADSMFAPTLRGGSTHSCGEYCTFNPTKAKKLLAKAGGWHGKMTIPFPGGAGYDDLFNAIANQLHENLGIKSVSAEPSTGFPDFLKNLTDKKYTNGPFRGKWGAPYPSAQTFISDLFTPHGAGYNSTYYSSDAVTKLLNRANAAGTPAKAVAGYRDAEKSAMSDFPVAPLFWERFVFATSDHVTNVKPTPGTIGLQLAKVKVQ